MHPTWRNFWGRIMAKFFERKKAVVAVPHAPDQNKRAAEARLAVRKSRALMDKVESREGEVDSLHRSMRRIGEQNGFADLIYRSLGGGA